MKLTEAQKIKLRQLNQEVKSIMLERKENPDSFDNHINCLRKFEKATHTWLDFMSPYLNYHLDQSEKLSATKWNVIKRHKIKTKLEKYDKILDEIDAIVFDDELNQIKTSFLDKPVTSIHVNIDRKSEASIRNGQATFFKSENAVTYTIDFSDGTHIQWNSLEDEVQMEKARRIFEEKVPQAPKLNPSETESSDFDTAKSEETSEITEVANTQQEESIPYAGCCIM